MSGARSSWGCRRACMKGTKVAEKSLTWLRTRLLVLKNFLDLVVLRGVAEAVRNPTVMTTHLWGKAFHLPSKQIASLPVT